LIIVVDLQINQFIVSIHLLAFSLLIKVQFELKVRIFRLSVVNSTKVQSQLNYSNQSTVSIIGKNLFNQMKFSK